MLRNKAPPAPSPAPLGESGWFCSGMGGFAPEQMGGFAALFLGGYAPFHPIRKRSNLRPLLLQNINQYGIQI